MAFLLHSNPLAAQGLPRSTLRGRVTDAEGRGIGGARVAVASEALQGRRDTSTVAGGEFVLDLLPPGDYSVAVSRAGLEPVERRVSLQAGGTMRVEIALRPAAVRETVTVWDQAPVLAIEGMGVATSLRQELVDRLPTDRTLRSTALLAPGVSDHGPAGSAGSANQRPAITVSGAPSYDNLFLVDGVVVNENLRGQPQDLFIEDAIQETTVQSGRISAEYGRFTGGVVSAITRSGGNSLHATLRASLTNDAWTENDPYDQALGLDARDDEIDAAYEATLGGPLARDRVWLFVAGRDAGLTDVLATRPTARPGDVGPVASTYRHAIDEWRLEAKVTGAVSASHDLVGSFIVVDQSETGSTFNPNILDLDGSLIDVERPNSLLALHYDAVLTDTLFLEAQRSLRSFTIEQDGATPTDRVAGTRIFDNSRQLAGYHSPQAPLLSAQRYDNDSWLAKAARFFSGAASHDLRAGYERYAESAAANQHVSGSDFRVFATTSILRGTEVFPSIRPADTLRWSPIVEPTTGTDLVTHSLFVNDRINGAGRWSFNLGLRYDRNDARDGAGNGVSRRGSFSPRLEAGRELAKNGGVRITAGFARYAAKLHDNLAAAGSAAGQRSELRWVYDGPCINCDLGAPTATLLGADAALARVFEWFDGIGGVESQPAAAMIPGISSRLAPGGIESPSVDEYSLGTRVRLGARGFLTIDLIDRDYRHYYASRIDLSTGKTDPDRYGRIFDVSVVGDSATLDRHYRGVHAQFDYRTRERVTAGGTYTWSRLTGNFGGENRALSALAAAIDEYPEYKERRWSYPGGTLSGGLPAAQSVGDQRHRAKAWIGYRPRFPLGDLDLVALESYDSGLPYEATGSIDPRPYVVNPGYRTPPPGVAYFFTRQGAFHTDDVTRTDVALTWTLPVHGPLELFVQPQVTNLFDEDAVTAVDATVTVLARFDPFTAAPVRGVNYELGPQFGLPTNASGYQQPRTFRVELGARF